MGFTIGPKVESSREGPSSGAHAPIAGASDAPAPAAAPLEPEQAPDSGSVEALREAAVAKASERKAAAAEKAARIRERTAALKEREARIDAVEARLRAWRQRPDLAVEDLSSFGVTFESMAQAVAQGGATPDQIAAAEAAQARQEIAELKRGLADRDARERADRIASQRRAEEAAVTSWTEELAETVDPARHPLVSHFGQEAFGQALAVAERMYESTGRVPRNAAVLDQLETDLRADLDAAYSARAGRGAAAPRGAVDARPRGGQPESAADRRARFLREVLDPALRKIR
jgi:hypothetical protein